MSPQVTCIGEVLVDFVATRNGTSLATAPAFAKCAGGAAANVAAGLSRLGIRTAMVAKVGEDAFGRFLRDELSRFGLDTSHVTPDRTHKTRLAFVSLERSGERDFDFWQEAPADERLAPGDVRISAVARSGIVHIGAFLLLGNPSRSTALGAAVTLKGKGVQISFDPNLRLSLWKSAKEARRVNLAMARHAAILRLNEDEAQFLTGERNVRAAADSLLALGPAIVVATMGKRGCFLRTREGSAFIKGFSVRAVDTTGCGDAFLAGLLAGIVQTKQRPASVSLATLKTICRFANAAGALTAMRRGGMPAMPTRGQVEAFLVRRR